MSVSEKSLLEEATAKMEAPRGEQERSDFLFQPAAARLLLKSSQAGIAKPSGTSQASSLLHLNNFKITPNQ